MFIAVRKKPRYWYLEDEVLLTGGIKKGFQIDANFQEVPVNFFRLETKYGIEFEFLHLSLLDNESN